MSKMNRPPKNVKNDATVQNVKKAKTTKNSKFVKYVQAVLIVPNVWLPIKTGFHPTTYRCVFGEKEQVRIGLPFMAGEGTAFGRMFFPISGMKRATDNIRRGVGTVISRP